MLLFQKCNESKSTICTHPAALAKRLEILSVSFLCTIYTHYIHTLYMYVCTVCMQCGDVRKGGRGEGEYNYVCTCETITRLRFSKVPVFSGNPLTSLATSQLHCPAQLYKWFIFSISLSLSLFIPPFIPIQWYILCDVPYAPENQSSASGKPPPPNLVTTTTTIAMMSSFH